MSDFLSRAPHPIPYQGSKRRLARAILAAALEGRARPVRRLIEPFAGSGAVSLAAAQAGLAERFVLGDSLPPLAALWRAALADPDRLAEGYARLWDGGDAPGHYERVRADYNRGGDPARLLYLLARCVKNSPRWNRAGEFNQSADRRRRGVHPLRLRRELLAAARLLAARTEVVCADFAETVASARPDDLVYLDPPWEGVSAGGDRRYHQGLDRARLVEELERLARRRVPFLLSYDGRCGRRRYGAPLPRAFGERIELDAGRSSQATLLGRTARTVESLYVSRGA